MDSDYGEREGTARARRAGGLRARRVRGRARRPAWPPTARTTTGPLYHHFGSKLGLYAFVRDDVERRVTDRLEGALAVTIHDDVGAALVVAFDYALRAGFARMLSEPHPEARPDPVAAVLGEPPVGAMLAAAWRAGLGAAADGVDARARARRAARAHSSGVSGSRSDVRWNSRPLSSSEPWSPVSRKPSASKAASSFW